MFDSICTKGSLLSVSLNVFGPVQDETVHCGPVLIEGPLPCCVGAQITGHLSLKEKKDREVGCGNNLSLESSSPGVEPTSWGKRGGEAPG